MTVPIYGIMRRALEQAAQEISSPWSFGLWKANGGLNGVAPRSLRGREIPAVKKIPSKNEPLKGCFGRLSITTIRCRKPCLRSRGEQQQSQLLACGLDVAGDRRIRKRLMDAEIGVSATVACYRIPCPLIVDRVQIFPDPS